MFGLNESTQYYVCQRYVRMNLGINGLYQIVRTEMELPVEEPLYGINITFPNGTVVSVKKGCAQSVMELIKLYEKEDAVCLD